VTTPPTRAVGTPISFELSSTYGLNLVLAD
jgi:hypothetical protein